MQKVYIEDNEIDVFKKINFNNNNVQHIVVVNGKEFTENTDLK